MNIILTGGGTGGHIYPAIAIADKIKEKNPNFKVILGIIDFLNKHILVSF